MARAAELRANSIAAHRKGEIEEHEILPKTWPQQMARYVIDPQTGFAINWPWPNKDWSYNAHAIEAIYIVRYMDNLLEKHASQWTPEDDRFYMAIEEALEENGRDSTAL